MDDRCSYERLHRREGRWDDGDDRLVVMLSFMKSRSTQIQNLSAPARTTTGRRQPHPDSLAYQTSFRKQRRSTCRITASCNMDLDQFGEDETQSQPLSSMVDVGGFDDEGEVENKDPAILRRALFNERASPRILPFEQRVVVELTEIISHQQAVCDEILEDPKSTADDKFAVSLYQMEIDRLKYLIASYLRTRLRKIQLYPLHIVKSDLKYRLSTAEDTFLRQYVDIMGHHMNESVLSSLPEQFRTLSDDGSERSGISMIPSPNLHKYVFIQARENIGDVELEDRDSITLAKGDVYALSYKPIEPLLLEGKVRVL